MERQSDKLRQAISRVVTEKLRSIGLFFFATHCLAYVSDAYARDIENPSFELALNDDHRLCPQILNLYNRFLIDLNKAGPSGVKITNFSLLYPTEFAKVGLFMPEAITAQSDDAGFISNTTTSFFVTKAEEGQLPLVIAQKDTYRGNSPSTVIAILRPGVSPKIAESFEAMSSEIPIPSRDIALTISVTALANSQIDRTHLQGNYLLKKWPGFTNLLSSYEDWLRSPNGVFSSALPALAENGLGVTIRPFQNQGASLYFILDQYAPLSIIRNLSINPRFSVITVVQKLTGSELRDVCYLVVRPSSLADTLRKK